MKCNNFFIVFAVYLKGVLKVMKNILNRKDRGMKGASYVLLKLWV